MVHNLGLWYYCANGVPYTVYFKLMKLLPFLLAKIYFIVCDASLEGFIERSDRVSDHEIAQNVSFQKSELCEISCCH